MRSLNISYSYLKSTDPYENLAIENQILENLPNNSMHILLWVNRPCIVMGRFQNPLLECQIDRMIKDDILIVRRQSGGGCVYHDLGNLNYSFITNKEFHNKDNNHLILINALRSLNINSYSTKRVDLFTEHDNLQKKFSGSAFKEKKDTAFHHGTLLINSDLDKLNYYLTPKDLSVTSVSIDSVRSKVVNLSDLNSRISIELVVEAIIEEAKKFYKSVVKEVLNPQIDKNHLNKIKDKKWYFAETPKFRIFDNIDEVGDIELEVKKMKVLSISVSCTSVHESFISEVSDSLVGQSLLDRTYLDNLVVLSSKYEMYSDFVDRLTLWLEDQFNVLRR